QLHLARRIRRGRVVGLELGGVALGEERVEAFLVERLDLPRREGGVALGPEAHELSRLGGVARAWLGPSAPRAPAARRTAGGLRAPEEIFDLRPRGSQEREHAGSWCKKQTGGVTWAP